MSRGLSMSAKLDGDDVNSGGPVREEIKEVSGGTVGGSKCKTFMDNTSYPGQVGSGMLNDGVRVFVNSKIELGGGCLGRGLKLTDKFDQPKLRVVEMMSRDDGGGSMGVMNLVEKVLGGSFSIGNDGEDLKNSEKNADINIVANWNAWQGVNRESIFENESVINDGVTNKNFGNRYTDSPGEGAGPKGEHHLIISEQVPDSKLENDGVNIVNAGALISKEYRDACIDVNEREYSVSDLVWGKVNNRPWWPGQIFAPLAASDKAKIHFRKDSYLIAFFGDLTFAWNEVSKIKPFRGHFFLLEKQSKAEGFCHAVDCALDEVARRVELGLSCSCLPKEVHDKIKSQVVENAGIREASSIRNGGDSISTAFLFFPDDLLQFIKYCAVSPHSETDRLHFVITKAQLLAFNRWRGLYQLPELEQHYLLLEDNAQFNVEQGVMDSEGVSEGVFLNSKYTIEVPSKERKSTARYFSSRNPKRLSSDSNIRRQKSLSSLGPSDYMSSQPMSHPRVGGSIKRRLDSGDASSVGEMATSNVRKSRRKQMALAEFPPDEILSKLSLAAINPMQGHYILTSIIGLLGQIRNSMCLEKSSLQNENKHAGKRPISWETRDTPRFDGTVDAYHIQEHVVCEPKIRTERDVAIAELEAGASMIRNLGDQNQHVILDPETEHTSIQTNEMFEECFPTALILNFKNLESIPSIANLHEMCRLYGPLNELKTELLSKGKRAKVVFKRKVDAESIFSHIREYSPFGPSLDSCRLHALPRKSHATSKSIKKDTSINASLHTLG